MNKRIVCRWLPTSTCMCLPKSLLINGLVLKGSKSSMCSPVPIKIIGLFVSATLKNKNINIEIIDIKVHPS